MESAEELGRKGEEAFSRLCNSWRCEYLHIGQDKDGLSSEMFRNYEKRPDFLVNIPDIAAIFVEVKTKELGKYRPQGPLSKYPAFMESHRSFSRIRNFESRVRVSTWYAFLPRTRTGVDETLAYLCPISRIEKHIPKHARDDFLKWPDIWIPRDCMNQCSMSSPLDLTDKCLGCNLGICEIDNPMGKDRMRV